MDVLIIGGTQFVGRHLAEAALEAGHKVTLFNRGKTGPGLYPQAETLVGDRDGDLDALKGRKWDVVFDPSGYLPRVVQQSAELLKDAVGRYVFISSISVYVDSDEADENAPLNTMDDDPTSEDIPKYYGALKVACENVVSEIYGDRALNARPGFIIGPYDPVPRLPGLLWRYDRDGERVAGRPEQGVQVIHARDMADWLLKAVDQKLSGAYNLTGRPVKMNDLLDTVVSLTGKNTTVSYVGDELLKVRDIPPVDGVGYWVPAEAEGIMRANVDKVFAAGYTERPLRQSISETLEWLRREGFQSDNLKERIEGRVLSMEKETEILEAFKQQDN
ncbi:MAG: NAD-dependent epimerase/dehydratase family protein [Chloroflexi bacterium]|nr:NAD-dependent epimerase/dehydratase family protein [Chloroflexota bacterium]